MVKSIRVSVLRDRHFGPQEKFNKMLRNITMSYLDNKFISSHRGCSCLSNLFKLIKLSHTQFRFALFIQ